MTSITLKPGREKSLLRHHPWLFSGAIASIKTDTPNPAIPGSADPAPGTPADILSARGDFLARGFYSPASQLRVRAATFDPQQALDSAWLRATIAAAAARRATLFASDPTRNAFRLVHGESDSLPGLIIDRYNTTLCLQILSAGFERFREVFAPLLFELFPEIDALYERSDATARTREGLEPRTGLLALRSGLPANRIPDFSAIPVTLNGIQTAVNISGGQKTGSYLDQALNHAAVAKHAAGLEVLDTFSYDGGFTLACLRAGAKAVTAVDSSEGALAALQQNLQRNALPSGRVTTLCADVFTQLRSFRDSRRSFDLIILDPPKFADNKAHLPKACRAYKDINLLAFKLLSPGGLLATFSCSGAVDPALFQTIVAEAALDAHRAVRVLETYRQAPDHSVLLSFPESLYLKGLLVRCD